MASGIVNRRTGICPLKHAKTIAGCLFRFALAVAVLMPAIPIALTFDRDRWHWTNISDKPRTSGIGFFLNKKLVWFSVVHCEKKPWELSGPQWACKSGREYIYFSELRDDASSWARCEKWIFQSDPVFRRAGWDNFYYQVIRGREYPNYRGNEPPLTVIKCDSFDVGASFSLFATLWAIVAIGSVYALLVPPLRRWRRQKQGFCAKCGYNLARLTEPRCPECGTKFTTLPDKSPHRGEGV